MLGVARRRSGVRPQERSHGRGLHRRSGTQPGRTTRRRPVAGPPRRPRRALDQGADRAGGRRPRRHRRRRVRQRRQHRPERRRHRPDLLARHRLPRARARHHRRPPVRIGAAGRALRRAGGDVRHHGPRRRRRRAEHEPDPDHERDGGRPEVRPRDAVLQLARLAGALRRPRGLAVPRGRDDRREVEHLPGRHGAVRGRVARACAAGARGRSVRERDRAARRVHVRRRAARAELGEDPLPAHPHRRWSTHRRGVESDQRRVRRAPDRRRAGGEGPRLDAACAHPPHERARRRPRS